MKNKFFTNELVRFANIVLTPKFAGIGSMDGQSGRLSMMEVYYENDI